MSGLKCYYLFEETTTDGKITSQKRLEYNEVRPYLMDVIGIGFDQVDFALAVTADNVGVPYVLHKATEEGRLIYCANLTLKVEYWRH